MKPLLVSMLLAGIATLRLSGAVLASPLEAGGNARPVPRDDRMKK